MENSIEVIWKEGFLDEKSLVAPRINDLYNQKSIHLTDKLKSMYRMNLIMLFAMAVFFPVWFYFMDFVWEGIATSVLLLLTIGYSLLQKQKIKTLDHGASSLDYLQSFNRLLTDALARGEKVLRFSYPLYFLITVSTLFATWNKGPLSAKIPQEFPGFIYVGNIPLFVIIIVAVATLLIAYFSGRIYRWDVRLVYGRVLQKLEETIAEMEKLKQGV